MLSVLTVTGPGMGLLKMPVITGPSRHATARATPTLIDTSFIVGKNTAMPELPEVEAVRRRLEPVMARKRFKRVIVRRPDLRTPFPHRFAARLAGQTALTVGRRAKYLLIPLSSGETLVMHLGMSGSFEIDVERADPEDTRHDHVVFRMSSGAVVTFNDPRRFGFMDLLDREALAAHPVLSRLG